MACERNRILELKKYLSSLGIDTNISKTNARGHNGVFIHKAGGFRIDISKKLDDENVLPVMLHEFAHYIHYSYDKNLKSLDFIFGELTDEVKEELIKITVHKIPKDFASSLYSAKDKVNLEIRELSEKIKKEHKDFKLSQNYKAIEKNFSNPLKYLLKYDNVKIFNKVYSINKLDVDFNLTETETEYIKLKSKQRYLRRINSKINRLNKYYNNPTELFARFIELYYTDSDKAKQLAPSLCEKMKTTKIPAFEKINQIMNV
jgi:hypothetical protein